MDEKNEVEAVEKAYGEKWDAQHGALMPPGERHKLALKHAFDAVLASLAARGGTLSAEQLAFMRESAIRSGSPTVVSILDHAAAQGATIAALQQRVESWRDEATAAQGERDAAKQRAEQAEREREAERSRAELHAQAEGAALEKKHEYRTRAVAAESALATLRQAAVRWVAGGAGRLSWNDGAKRYVRPHQRPCGCVGCELVDALYATPAPEHQGNDSTPSNGSEHPDTAKLEAAWAEARKVAPVDKLGVPLAEVVASLVADTVALRAIYERADDSAWLQAIALRLGMGKVSFEQIQALIRAVVGDSGPSGGGETCCGEQGKCSDCPPNPPAPGLAACVPVERTAHVVATSINSGAEHHAAVQDGVVVVRPAQPVVTSVVPVSATPAAHLDATLAEYHGEPTK